MEKIKFSFFLLLVFLTIVVFSPILSLSDNCGYCYTNYTPQCELICGKLTEDKKPKCLKRCLIKNCSSQCDYNSSSLSATQSRGARGQANTSSSLVDCDYCQRLNSAECSTKCSDKPKSCYKICLSQACSSTCRLPAPASELIETKNTKEECARCKTTVEQGCKSSCGSGQGSISCAVACVERKCEKTCLID